MSSPSFTVILPVGSIFENNVVVDGRLITGQNPASAKDLGVVLVKALKMQAQ